MRRGTMLAVPFFLGVLAMSPAVGDEKKFDRADKDTYAEKVTIREWSGDKFINPAKDIVAHRAELGGKPVYYTAPRPGVKSPKGSEIIDKDGTVWVVTESKKLTGNFTHYLNYVEKKKD